MKVFTLRVFIIWILSVPTALLAVGFLDSFYPAFIEVLLLTVLTQSFVGLLIHLLLDKANHLRSDRAFELTLSLVLCIVLISFWTYLFVRASQYPRLFDNGYFIPQNGTWLPVTIGGILTFPLFFLIPRLIPREKIEHSRIFQLLNDNAAGVLLAGIFFIIYLVPAVIFNQPRFDVDDIFFDSDGLLWRTRFTTDAYRDYYWRSPHPFVLLIIRPLVSIGAFFLKGDMLHSAFLLVAFAGALGVFFAWYFIKHTTHNPLHSVLVASLLGASASHLVFGSLIETYVFLAAVMSIFLALLLKNSSLAALALTGLLSFGITIANFAQTAIAFIVIRRNFRQWIKYGLIVGALVVPLALLNNLVYPNSQPYFFIPSSLTTEADNTFSPSFARGVAILRVMFFHSIVAPDPLILEEEIPFLKVWIFKADPLRTGEYDTAFGTLLGFVWLGLLLGGGFLFLKGWGKIDNRFSLAFALILIMNFILHLRYGKDVFLYSANWTYAIVLFLGLAWRELAGKRWFQVALLVFLALLLANNSRLLLTMLETSALHLN